MNNRMFQREIAPLSAATTEQGTQTRPVWGVAYLPESYLAPDPDTTNHQSRRRTTRLLLAGFFLLVGISVWLSLQLIHERHLAHKLRSQETLACGEKQSL